jgi:hypothetical protein
MVSSARPTLSSALQSPPRPPDTLIVLIPLTASEKLEMMLEKYGSARDRYDPRLDVFRHYFYIFQDVRDDKGSRLSSSALRFNMLPGFWKI